MQTVSLETIEITRDSGVVTITLNRPDKLNAFRGKTVEEMIDALQNGAGDGTGLRQAHGFITTLREAWEQMPR